MMVPIGRFGLVVACVLWVGACTSGSSGEDTQNPVVTASTAVASTSTPPTPSTSEAVASSTSTTLSAFEIRQAAEADIEAVIKAWYTYPYDTSLGPDGMPLAYTTGPLHQRNQDLVARRADAGEIQRARGGSRIEVVSIRLDLEAGMADVDVCTLGDGELVDAETGEVLAADDGDSWEGEAHLILVAGQWLVEDFSSDQATGGNECVLSE
ncbi:MAG: hypothetical protein GY701_00630 [Sulfitobacter sp.]|nr:hypothetical protein [Sulfitobacter sp.]